MFAQRLKIAREYRGHSQASLAELLNVAPQQIYRLETGKHTPSSETVVLLSQALKVSADYLLGLSDAMIGRYDVLELRADEQRVLDAMRHGDKIGAIKAIVGE
jgi:transcriptional regulator with XRE-family HTH domain